MTNKGHLPFLGPGPFYVVVIITITIAAFLCRNKPVFTVGYIQVLKTPFIITGLLLILFSLFLWIKAVVFDKIDNNIKINKLVTTGAYAWVRNPIYSAFMLICTGIILIIGNLFFFILPLLYWAFLTILMKHTEEKWLFGLYGEDYREYCCKVNRCIPWFPKLKNGNTGVKNKIR